MKIYFKNFKEAEFDDVDWSHLSQVADQRRAFVHILVNISVPEKGKSFFTN
jgi:hypothetical protein